MILIYRNCFVWGHGDPHNWMVTEHCRQIAALQLSNSAQWAFLFLLCLFLFCFCFFVVVFLFTPLQTRNSARWEKFVCQCNGNIFISMKFSSMVSLEVVKMTTSVAASYENFVTMTVFSFQCVWQLCLAIHLPLTSNICSFTWWASYGT